MGTLLKIEFTIPQEKADQASIYIASKVPHGWEETPKNDEVQITLYLEDHPLGMEMIEQFKQTFPETDVIYSEQEPEDWAMAWKDFFTPVFCGETFRIIPPWLSENTNDEITHIVIEPKMAFGTGHHPTTALCLETIGKLSQSQTIQAKQTFLDLGTGSGILAIGLAKLGLSGKGLDIDPQAIVCAVENTEKNNVTESIDLAVGSIDCLNENTTFDLVVANILSGPLIEMAREIIAHVQHGGCLVLSGILAGSQADAVADAYVRQGLKAPSSRHIDGEWECLVWENIGV